MRLRFNRLTILAPVLFLFFLLSGLNIVLAGTVQLPRTGQTTCYDINGNVISCGGTGQDGDLQEGLAWPSPRFTDNGDQTQTDNLTKLIWLKDGSAPASGICTGGATTWQGALSYVACLNATNYLGHNDWRLPDINEIESLVDAGQSHPATWLNGQGFTNVQLDGYWSSTSSEYFLSYAVIISMYDGGVYRNGKYNGYYAWPVRGGQDTSVIWRTGQTTCYDSSGNIISCTGTGQDGELQKGIAWPSPRFTDNGDQSVTDNLTYLMWTKSANAPGPSACSSGTYMTWPGALSYVACLNTNKYLGHSDWRLPNRKELYSLVDFSQSSPSLPVGNPFTDVQSSDYWSSTSSSYLPSYAWFVDMGDGVNVHPYTVSGYVWPVRTGLYSVSGTIDSNTVGISGVTVTLSGAASATTTTDSEGNYIFAGLKDGSYTITVNKPGYTFSPASKDVAVYGSSLTGVNLSGSVGTMKPTAGNVLSRNGWEVDVADTSVTNPPSDGCIATVTWGDGTATTQKCGTTFSKVYTKAGTYAVMEIVEDTVNTLSSSCVPYETSVPVKYSVTVAVTDGANPLSMAAVYLYGSNGEQYAGMTGLFGAPGSVTINGVNSDYYGINVVKGGYTCTPANVSTTSGNGSASSVCTLN